VHARPPQIEVPPTCPGPAARLTVTRIGTQVVVRLGGVLDDACADRLAAAVDEVADLVLERVVVDLDDVARVDDAGLHFLAQLHGRWRVRLLNCPPGLRARLPRQAG
jgi:anti-anti-sigma regulatory factor